jgi:GNAT superfamily N-acetyltransferase
VAAVRFDMAYDERAVLDDGTPVHLRLVRPEDKQLMREAWERVSPESRYRRFFCAKSELSDADLSYLTEVDHVDHVAIGAAWDRGGEQAIGVARFIRCVDRSEAAEAAIVVTDDAQGRGLGHLLLTRLGEAALERGIGHFVCDVLADNDTMRTLLHELAPGAVEHPDGEVIHIEMPLHAPPTATPLRRLLALFAAGLLRIRATLAREGG